MSHGGVDPSVFRSVPPEGERYINPDFAPGQQELNLLTNLVSQDKLIDAALYTGHPFGRENTEASRPTIEFPLYNIRTALNSPESEEQDLQSIYNELLSNFPENIQTRLAEEMAKPANERNPVYTNLDNYLTMTAGALGWLQSISEPFPAGSAAINNIENNMALSGQALTDLIDQNQTLVTVGQSFLRIAGPNHPSFDRVSEQVNALDNATDEFQQAYEAVENGNTSDEALAALNSSAERLNTLNTEFHRVNSGGDGQIIGSLMNAMALLSAATTLDPGMRSLLIGMAFVNIGLVSSDSASGLIGEQLQNFSQAISDFIIGSFMADIAVGGREITPLFTTTIVIAAIITGNIATGNIGSRNASVEAFSSIEGRYQDFPLWTLMLSTLVEQAVIAEILEDNESALPLGLASDFTVQELINDTVTLLAIMIHLASIGSTDEEAMHNLAETLSPTLLAEIATLASFLERAQSDPELFPNLDQDLVTHLAVNFTQMQIALGTQDFTAFFEGFDGILDAFDIDREALNEELEQMRESTEFILNAFTGGMDDSANTLTGMTSI